MTLGGAVAAWACSAAAETAYAADSGSASFVKLLTERLEFTVRKIPALGHHLASLPDIVGGSTALLLLGIVAGGLAAEYAVRLLLNRARLHGFDRLVGHSPLRAFGRAILLDLIAVVAMAIVAYLIMARVGDAQSVGGKLGRQVFQAMLYWRVYNLVFRAWLRPSTPEGRIAPVDDAAARGLLVALNWIVVLPLLAGHAARALTNTGAAADVVSAALILYVPFVAVALLWVVWHWRNEMAAWLTAMVPQNKIGRQLKLDAARRWWIFGL
ncbi:MAG TPA: hypothetical protein VF915_05530, partial [Reyranella sp.]